METNRLRQFRVIVETVNLRKAADLLGISHSGLSKSMKALETEIGFPLFHASGRGLVISDRGLQVNRLLDDLLNRVDQVLGVNQAPQLTTLRIGSFEVFTSYFIGPLLKSYLPQTQVEIHELVPGRLEEALAFNQIDIGVTYEPIPHQTIEYIKITSLTMGAYASKEQIKHFAKQHLSEVPFVVPVSPLEGAPSGVKGRDGWPDEKINRHIRYRVDLMSTGLEIARQGLAAIFIPRFVAKLHNQSVVPQHQLELLQLPKSLGLVRRNVFIVKRESTTETNEIRQLAKALRTICHD